MTTQRNLRLKWTLKAHNKQVIFVKGTNESPEHVLMKAFLWALYLPQYPDIIVERRIEKSDRYKPDLFALDTNSQPIFWGESGKVGLEKLQKLLKRHKDTHFAFAKWQDNLKPFIALVEQALEGVKRTAPVDVISFPDDSHTRFIDKNGVIQITHDDLTWQRL